MRVESTYPLGRMFVINRICAIGDKGPKAYTNTDYSTAVPQRSTTAENVHLLVDRLFYMQTTVD
jgi:hypothetical protein